MNYNADILTKVIQQTFLSKRRRLGMTQLGLSLQSKITRQFISQVEGGKRSPSIFTMSALAAVSNLTLSELFNEIDELYREYEELEKSSIHINFKDACILNERCSTAASKNCANNYIQNTAAKKHKKSP